MIDMTRKAAEGHFTIHGDLGKAAKLAAVRANQQMQLRNLRAAQKRERISKRALDGIK